jgi:hypothetical protein
MSGAAFLRIKKLKGGGIITVAARHNRRVIQAEVGASGSIDSTRSHLNETLQGPLTAADVGQRAKELIGAAGVVKPRKDAVMALEIVFSLPPGHRIDDRAFFSDSASWAGAYFGGAQNILSVDIHRDEGAPHCHVLLVPLLNNRLAGSDMVGNRQTLLAMQSHFHDAVSSRYGLSKAPARLSGTTKQAAASAVLQSLRETSDTALRSKVWATLREVIETDPGRFMLALGITLDAPKKSLKTMAQIFTGKGKGATKETNPIGFGAPAKKQTLCSVGFPPKPSPPAPTKPAPARLEHVPSVTPSSPPAPATTTPEPERVVVRDSDLDPALFDMTTGEFIKRPPPPARNNRAAADEWAATELKRKGRLAY